MAFVNATSGSGNTSRKIEVVVTMHYVVQLNGALDEGQFVGQISGQPSHEYVVEASTNLLHWSVFKTDTTDASGNLSFRDGTTTPGKFYRARAQ